jgi:hypothetical protein
MTPNRFIKKILSLDVVNVELYHVHEISDLLEKQVAILRFANNAGIGFERILPQEQAHRLARRAGIHVDEFGRKPLLEEGLLLGASSAPEITPALIRGS